MRMPATVASCTAVALALCLVATAIAAPPPPAPAAAGKKYYRWVDDKGQVHYGDRVPPEYSQRDTEVLNRQGVPVSRIEGNVTAEEATEKAQQELALKRAAQSRQRDRILLQTYLSVREIERLRDSRLEVIDSQMRIQQQYMVQLKQQHERQLQLAAAYKPYSTDPAAEPAPEGMIADIQRSEADLRTQEGNLQKKRAERESLKARFDLDISRFKELKSMKPGMAAPGPAKPAPPAAAPR